MAARMKRSRSRRAPRRFKRSGRRRIAPIVQNRFFKHKMVLLTKITSNGQAQGTVIKTVALQQVADTAALAGNIGFDSSPRWQPTFPNYEQYAITGCKVKFIPTNSRGGSFTGTAIRPQQNPTWTWYDPDDLDAGTQSEEAVVSGDYCRLYDPTRAWSRYFNMKGISKS